MELSLLCDCSIVLIIKDNDSQEKISYASDTNEESLINWSKNFVEPMYSNKDVSILLTEIVQKFFRS